MTLAFVQPKLDEHEIDAGDRLKTVSPRDTITIGPFSIEFIRVTHSMPDCVALAITTPAGTIVHTGDFKIDQTPIDGSTSTCIASPSWARKACSHSSPTAPTSIVRLHRSETDVIDAFEELFTSTHGKLVVAAFSSSIYRMQVLVDLAVQFERKVAFVGRSIVQNSEIAQRLGFLRIPRASRFATATSRTTRRRTCCVSRPGRRANRRPRSPVSPFDDHRFVKLAPTITVVLSARAIPGNEKAIAAQ
jgi:ribonuclease J